MLHHVQNTFSRILPFLLDAKRRESRRGTAEKVCRDGKKNWKSIMRARRSSPWGKSDLIEIWLRGREH